MFYLITIILSILFIATANLFPLGVFSWSAYGTHIGITCLGVICVFAIDGMMAFFIRRLPQKWFAPDNKLFTVPKWERNLYRKSKINLWKKYVPEWGCFTGFHKDKMRESHNSEYVGRFLIESNYGVAGHLAGAV